MHGIALSAITVVLFAGCSFGGGDENDGALERADLVVNLVAGRIVFADPTAEPDEDLGAVGLTARGTRTVVTIEVARQREARQRAEIRGGDCATIGTGIVYTLNPVLEGKSETVVDAPLRELRARYMVLVHDVPAEAQIAGIVTALVNGRALCADLSRARSPGATPVWE